MLLIKPSSADEFTRALSLIKENMEVHLANSDISWDDDWNRQNYISKDNYSIFRRDEWIGYLSLEIIQECLYVHTLQLTTDVQGKIFGFRVYQWIKAKAYSSNCRLIGCKTFTSSPVVPLYKRLGFKIVRTEGVLSQLQLDLPK